MTGLEQRAGARGGVVISLLPVQDWSRNCGTGPGRGCFPYQAAAAGVGGRAIGNSQKKFFLVKFV